MSMIKCNKCNKLYVKWYLPFHKCGLKKKKKEITRVKCEICNKIYNSNYIHKHKCKGKKIELDKINNITKEIFPNELKRNKFQLRFHLDFFKNKQNLFNLHKCLYDYFVDINVNKNYDKENNIIILNIDYKRFLFGEQINKTKKKYNQL